MNGEAGTAQRISGEDLETQEAAIREAGTFVAEVRNELAKRIVGQHALLDRVLMSLLTGGHILLEGVPGLAKTLTVSTLAEAIHTTFRRIQFTPDLLPADVVGTLVWEEKTGSFTPKRGPIFANIVLADEINRAPAKVQSALLEAMQERQVTIGEETHPLPVPFLVMATQNPIEHEGTYPLPEAQVDRFMFKTRVGYPAPEEERSIMRLMAGEDPPPIEAVVEPDRILAARAMLPAIYVDQRLEDYILQLVLATREPAAHGLTQFVDWIEFGASPRATIFLARAARAHAFIEGRAFVVPEDVKAIARDVLRHRLVLTFQAQAEQIDADHILDHLLETVPVP
ncbi:MAG: MoxR family ATPase [Gemmatimonadales bacterium]|nr:MoxR family ATPase [Candidatus Palauibacter denitrificans]